MSSRAISRSRVALATIEAAAIDRLMASPAITARPRQGSSGKSRPSTRAKPGARLKLHAARLMQAKVAPPDVQSVDFRRRRERHRNRQRPHANLLEQHRPPARGKFFRIVETVGKIGGIENHRRHADRPRERAASDLVNSGDRAETLRDHFGLKFEMRRHQDRPAKLREYFKSSACFKVRRSRQAWAFFNGARNR